MNGEVLARTGTENTFVELKVKRIGEEIYLAAELVDYDPHTGRYLRDCVGDVTVSEEDPEDTANAAIDAASDLEGVARRWLEELGALGWTDRDFGSAVELALEREAERRAVPVAAE